MIFDALAWLSSHPGQAVFWLVWTVTVLFLAASILVSVYELYQSRRERIAREADDRARKVLGAAHQVPRVR